MVSLSKICRMNKTDILVPQHSSTSTFLVRSCIEYFYGNFKSVEAYFHYFVLMVKDHERVAFVCVPE